MLLFIFTSLGVLVLENKVNLAIIRIVQFQIMLNCSPCLLHRTCRVRT